MEDGPLELTPDVYDHLRNLAGRIHRQTGRGHDTVQPTVLLHEAWIKVSQGTTTYESRAHFMATAARAMRQILCDRARAKASAKRGSNARRTTLTGLGADTEPVDVLALDQALDALEELDPNAARVVQLRTFGGLTVPEVAEVLDTSPRSVDRTWRFARSFLARHLAG